jgi:trk system potassium uptake protein TrkA
MKFAVIGLGSFGFNVAKSLYQSGREVLAIDRDKERVEEAKSYVTHAVVMEAADKENLEAVGLKNIDVVVVSLGPDLESSILAVLYLREIGVKRIVAKALTEDHAKILKTVGANEVIFPERDMAVRTAHRLISPNVLEYLPLLAGLSIQEIAPPDGFIGKSLKELDLINKLGIQVLAVKQLIPEKAAFIPTADFIVKDSDVLIILGEEKQLEKVNSLG